MYIQFPFVLFALILCSDARSQEPQHLLRLSHPHVSAIALSADGAYLASAGFEDIRIWDTSSGEVVRTMPGHRVVTGPIGMSGGTTSLVVLESEIVTTGADGNIRVWNLNDGRLLRTIAEPWIRREEGAGSLDIRRVPVDSVALSHDGKLLVGCVYGTVQIWNFKTGEHVRSIADETLRTEGMQVEQLVPPERRTDSFKWISSFLHEYLNYPEDVSPKTLVRWRTKGPLLDNLHSIAFSHNNQNIVASGWSTTYVWDANSGKLRYEVPDATYSAVSPRNSTLVTGSPMGPIQIWDLGTGEKKWTSERERITGLSFSGDGKWLFVKMGDCVQRWDAENWKMDSRMPPESDGASPRLFAVAADGTTMAASWTSTDNRLIDILSSHTE